MRFAAVVSASLVVAGFSGVVGGTPRHAVTIEDCVEFTHIQQTYLSNDPTVVFSPDGGQFVTMTWRGNLAKDTNEYQLMLFDATRLDKPPVVLKAAEFSHEEWYQHARPLHDFAFLSGNRLAMLATENGNPRQIVILDLKSRAETVLTHEAAGVRAFGIASDGTSWVYATRIEDDKAKLKELHRDGFSVLDPKATKSKSLSDLALGHWIDHRLRYYFVDHPGGAPRVIYEGPDPWVPSVFRVSPDGKWALAETYSYDASIPERSVTSRFELIDLKSGVMQPLAGSDLPTYGRVLWAPDSRSVVMFGDQKLVEVTLAPRTVSSLDVGKGWDLLGWSDNADGLYFSRSAYAHEADPKDTLALARRGSKGWMPLQVFSSSKSHFDLNPRYYAGTNGRLIVGVHDDLSTPPDLFAYDVHRRTARQLTHLNPQVSAWSLGDVSRIRWSGPYNRDSFGYLIKPVGYQPGKRYPLIIQIKDEGAFTEDNSFILDGTEQLSAAAIQVWANEGFMVLFTPDPPGIGKLMDTRQEDERFTAHIESGLDALEAQGLIDRSRVAITGWSRAGWQSEQVVAFGRTRFAAASNVDNVEYNLDQYTMFYDRSPDALAKHWGDLRPWGPTAKQWADIAIDWRYDKAQTPRLMEVHGQEWGSLLSFQESLTALRTAKIPVDLFWYPDEAHNLKAPIHRLRSLSTHNDWFRFWLLAYEDPAPDKAGQYERWRKMRDEWPQRPQ